MKQQKYLCLDCSYGVSGDMIVGSLIDVGVDVDALRSALDSLGLNVGINISKVQKKYNIATDFDVKLEIDNHDHDMSYLYGDKAIDIEFKTKRNIDQVQKIVFNSLLTENAKDMALRVFDTIAVAEAKAHGVAKNEVVFHETGAMDSIIDVCAIAICIDDLHLDGVFVVNLTEGKGTIRTRVGMMNIPTPAVKNVIDAFGLNVRYTDFSGELITPTGISAVATLAENCSLDMALYNVLRVGYGAGKRNYDLPCTLKAMIIERREL